MRKQINALLQKIITEKIKNSTIKQDIALAAGAQSSPAEYITERIKLHDEDLNGDTELADFQNTAIRSTVSLLITEIIQEFKNHIPWKAIYQDYRLATQNEKLSDLWIKTRKEIHSFVSDQEQIFIKNLTGDTLPQFLSASSSHRAPVPFFSAYFYFEHHHPNLVMKKFSPHQKTYRLREINDDLLNQNVAELFHKTIHFEDQQTQRTAETLLGKIFEELPHTIIEWIPTDAHTLTGTVKNSNLCTKLMGDDNRNRSELHLVLKPIEEISPEKYDLFAMLPLLFDILHYFHSDILSAIQQQSSQTDLGEPRARTPADADFRVHTI